MKIILLAVLALGLFAFMGVKSEARVTNPDWSDCSIKLGWGDMEADQINYGDYRITCKLTQRKGPSFKGNFKIVGWDGTYKGKVRFTGKKMRMIATFSDGTELRGRIVCITDRYSNPIKLKDADKTSIIDIKFRGAGLTNGWIYFN